MYSRSMVALAALGVALAPLSARGQDWRDVTSYRQRSDETRLDVYVRYGAGRLHIRPLTGGELYRVALRYDSDLFDPITEYRNGRLEVGVEGTGKSIRVKNHDQGELTLSLSESVPLDLDLDFGAVEAEIELGGLRITRLDIETGASDTEIRFARPNPIACERLEISMGAAALKAHGLGNVDCARVRVEGGVGDITLDFAGEWRRDVEADLTMALGSATLIIPENIGVRVNKETFLTDFDRDGFTKRDGAYYSSNWGTATRRLTIDLEGAFGSVTLRWSRPSGTTTP